MEGQIKTHLQSLNFQVFKHILQMLWLLCSKLSSVIKANRICELCMSCKRLNNIFDFFSEWKIWKYFLWMNKIQHCEKRISIVFCQTLFHLMCTPCGCTLCMVVGDYTIKMKTNFDFNFLYQGVKQHRYKKKHSKKEKLSIKKALFFNYL